ncbi:MAG: ribonuclease III [Bacteroidales bacterium]|nr:ribonuclease III [Bacteroidales bacterium]MCF8328317.1 ribonuclease III [Bacteroidales bacterium]
MSVFKPVKAHFSEDKELYESIKNIFGFFPGNIFLYKLALTHKSVATEIKEGVKDSNERLEYLGDAILGSIVADYLFKKFPFKDEGFLTETRSKIVSRAQLNNLSIRLGLNKLIESASNSNSQNGKSINGDAFEAFIGAMYLDKGFAFAHRIVTENIIKVHLDLDELVEKEVNFKSKLIEWAQKERKEIEFKVIKEQGSGNTKQYISKVFIDGVPHEQGVDFSIKGAEKLAAEKTFQQLSLNVDDL